MGSRSLDAPYHNPDTTVMLLYSSIFHFPKGFCGAGKLSEA